jgi:diacylglycerol kinase family enzyme
MTNKMKGKMPGDSYKLWVDIASLLYDRIYKVRPMDVRVYGQDGTAKDYRETVLLMAMGASGHRTYGSGKLILPDDRNLCIVKQMPLLKKVQLKELFQTGRHTELPESIMLDAGRIEFRGETPILAQMDGEAVLLDQADYPAVMELTERAVPLLREVGSRK